jgi:hypothetical protein
MSETMTLGLCDRLESYTLGRGVKVEKVVEIEKLAKGAGFEFADMRAFDLAITPEQLAKTRAAAAQRRAVAS